MNRWLLLFLLIILSFGFALQQTLQLGTPPKELPSIDTALTKLTWPKIVAGHYEWLSYDIKFSGDTADMTKTLTCALFGAIGDWAEYDKYNNPGGFHKPEVYNAIVKKFYHSPTIRLALYKWIKPFYIEAYKKEPQWERNILKNMLAHARKYIKEFNYQAELKIFNNKHGNFDRNGPNGLRGIFHRMETWIFRRVHNGDMTIQQMEQWADIFQKDLNSIK